jgi:hypothetical protein
MKRRNFEISLDIDDSNKAFKTIFYPKSIYKGKYDKGFDTLSAARLWIIRVLGQKIDLEYGELYKGQDKIKEYTKNIDGKVCELIPVK